MTPSESASDRAVTGTVRSKDGTTIAYSRQGSGPPVILVTGALDDGSENGSLATELASDFTAYNYNRRGRGDSGDHQPYALAREIEDLEALINVAGGSAHLYGVSSGGALALEAAAAGLEVTKVAVYEVPYMISADMIQAWHAYVEQLELALAEGRRGDASELFMRLAGSPEEQIQDARNSPYWPGVEALAHTLLYDAACLGAGEPPSERFATLRQPTLIATGGSDPFFEAAADALISLIPKAERKTLGGQGHTVDAQAMASALGRFLRDGS
jgi:pimeloyl-ACP methyl ester carboxylesterase